MARALTELQLARADASAQRFYSLSAQMRLECNAYCAQLEAAQKGGARYNRLVGVVSGLPESRPASNRTDVSQGANQSARSNTPPSRSMRGSNGCSTVSFPVQ